MGVIKINDDLQKSEEMSNFFLLLLEEFRIKLPKLSLFKILQGKFRPGLSGGIIASNVISRFNEAGIPSGPLEGGQPNVMEAYTKVFAEEMVRAIQNDMRVDVAIDPGMTVIAAGANAGGPIVTNGANPSPHSATGLAS